MKTSFLLFHLKDDLTHSKTCLLLILICDTLLVVWSGLLSRVTLDALSQTNIIGILSPLLIGMFLVIFLSLLDAVFTALYFRSSRIRVRIYRNSGISRKELLFTLGLERLILFVISFIFGVGIDSLIFLCINSGKDYVETNIMFSFINWEILGWMVLYSVLVPVISFIFGCFKFKKKYDIPSSCKRHL